MKTLFDRYSQYKPLVSGVYGQDVVTKVEEDEVEVDPSVTVKQLQTQSLIERMK